MLRQHLFKVIIIGDCTVGKTSLVQKYTNKTFIKQYKATVGVEFALKEIKWSHDEVIRVQIWDIAGQDRFTSMTRVYYKDAHGCIVMFDLTNKQTFQNAIKWKADLDSKVKQKDDSNVPCMLVGNKVDLVSEREISETEIETCSKEHDFLAWKEISVKENLMVDEAIRQLVKVIHERQAKIFDSDSFDDDRTDLSESDGEPKSTCKC